MLVFQLISPSFRRSISLYGKHKHNDNFEDQTILLWHILEAITYNKDNSEIIYSLLERNLDKLDDNFADILQRWATTTFSEVKIDEAESIASNIWYFSNYLAEFPLGNKRYNMEIAIAGYEAVLNVFTRESHPENWAETQTILATVYLDRTRNSRAENLEKAIHAYEQALLVFTRADFPIKWAMVQNNLAAAYLYRVRDDRSENAEKAINVEKAINFCHQALLVCTRADFPGEWAEIQNTLGIAYNERIFGDRAENVEQAINACHQALLVRTRTDFPIEWASTQTTLGKAYCERVSDDRVESVEKGIHAYEQALLVFTRADFPTEWGKIQRNLASAYTYRVSGDQSQNLENAITEYNLGLEVYTPEENPIDYIHTTSNLGNLHFKEGNWQLAIDAYEKAITAVELSHSWSQDDDGRQKILENAADVYQKIVQCFTNLKEYGKAVEYAERSRSQMVAELMASRELYPNAKIPSELLQKYNGMGQVLYYLRRDIFQEMANAEESCPAMALISGIVYHESLEERRQKFPYSITEIEEIRQQIWQDIRKSDPVLASQLQINPLNIEEMQALIKDEETRILSFYTTENDTYIFIVERQDVQLFTCKGEGFKALQNWIFDNWLQPYSDYRKRKNQQWRENMETFLQQLSQRLQLNQLITQYLSGIKELIIVPHIYLHQIPFAALPVNIQPASVGEEIPPTPLRKGGYRDEDLVSLLQRKAEGGLTREFENTRILIPTDITDEETPPLPAEKRKTPQTQVTYLSDIFRLRVIPSCQILSYCDKHKKTTNSKKMGIVENTIGDLIFTGYECQNVAKMFRVPKRRRLQYREATTQNYHKLAKEVQFLHFSHHASANLNNPLDSKLHLFDGDVTLGEIFTWRLPKLTDVFLSCCETNLTVSKLNDNVLTIAAGFLSAGAQSVVSTLWAVEEFATALFCVFYYENRQNPEYTRPQALHKAQFDLRNLTGKQLNDKYRQQLEAYLRGIETSGNRRRVRQMENHLMFLCQQEYPFNSPYYWAAFVSQGLQ